MGLMTRIRSNHIYIMEKTSDILENMLRDVPQETASTLRDGPNGWTTLEVLCHLRDFNEIFHQRAVMMQQQSYPDLPAYDHEAMAIERGYNSQNLKTVLTELVMGRDRLVEFFQNLSPEEWELAGIHPEKGHFTMTDAVIQVGSHEINHIEQITRILAQATA